MEIPLTEERKKLTALLESGDEDSIAKLEGINLLEKRNHLVPGDGEYYVFWEVKRCTPFMMPEALFSIPFYIMERRGYTQVDSPTSGDIMAYVSSRVKGHPLISWWGIYDNGKVRSRFGMGSVFEHNIEMVPLECGNEVIVFRKKEPATKRH